MKKNKIQRIKSLLLISVLTTTMLSPIMILAAQSSVKLGTTEGFAILAGSTITNTGETTITGDVGLHPGTEFTGQGSVTLNGEVNLANAKASQAKDDLIKAYDDTKALSDVKTIATELGGTTLVPGVYKSDSGTFEITGTLTLDSKGDEEAEFVFQMASTLITASDSEVVYTEKSNACSTFWQVGSSATLGVNSKFAGNVYAQESITANNKAKIDGQLLAITGAVTLDNNSITNQICEVAAPVVPVDPIKPDKPGEDEVVVPVVPTDPVVPTRPQAPKENQRETLPNVGITSNIQLYSSLITLSGVALITLNKKRK